VFDTPHNWQEFVERTVGPQARKEAIHLIAPDEISAAKALLDRLFIHHLGSGVFTPEPGVRFETFSFANLLGGIRRWSM
jgi:hypothetical protein